MGLFAILVGAAAVLAVLHMITPDHWLPLMAVSSVRKFSERKKYMISIFLGLAHAGTSIVVAVAALVVGILIIHNYLSYLYLGGIVLLVIIGIYFFITGLLERNRPESINNISMSTALSVSILPDLALMPIIITGASLTFFQLATILIVFTVISGTSLPIVVMGASRGFSKAIENIPPRYIDYIMGGILILTAIILKFL